MRRPKGTCLSFLYYKARGLETYINVQGNVQDQAGQRTYKTGQGNKPAVLGRATNQKKYVGTQQYKDMLRQGSTLQLVNHSTVKRIELLGPFVNGFILVIALGAVTQF